MIFEAIEFQPLTSNHHSHLHSPQTQQLLHHQHQQQLPPTPTLEFKSLDFSLTKRLLAAVFFLLVIYAWKQYLEDGEESDTIYI
uniref:Putative cpij013384 histone deacetylase 3 n=1 Tax=Culex tarsalis TaxID=7177 RepID=A0A1Q3F267_CULTA